MSAKMAIEVKRFATNPSRVGGRYWGSRVQFVEVRDVMNEGFHSL
jgi:hypothetical protein